MCQLVSEEFLTITELDGHHFTGYFTNTETDIDYSFVITVGNTCTRVLLNNGGDTYQVQVTNTTRDDFMRLVFSGIMNDTAYDTLIETVFSDV